MFSHAVRKNHVARVIRTLVQLLRHAVVHRADLLGACIEQTFCYTTDSSCSDVRTHARTHTHTHTHTHTNIWRKNRKDIEGSEDKDKI